MGFVSPVLAHQARERGLVQENVDWIVETLVNDDGASQIDFLTMPDFECVGLRYCSHRERDCCYGVGCGFSDVVGQHARSLRDLKVRNRDLAREGIDSAK